MPSPPSNSLAPQAATRSSCFYFPTYSIQFYALLCASHLPQYVQSIVCAQHVCVCVWVCVCMCMLAYVCAPEALRVASKDAASLIRVEAEFDCR